MAKKGAWFRVAAGDWQVGELADLLAVPISQAVGLYQEDENITDINDNQLERGAYWTGRETTKRDSQAASILFQDNGPIDSVKAVP